MRITSKNRQPQNFVILVSLGIVVVLLIGFFIFFQPLNKKTETFITPSIRVYDQTLTDEDLNRYIRQAQAAYQTTKLTAQTLDYAVNSALRDMAIEAEIKKVATKNEMKVTKAELEAHFKKRWPTEEELQVFMRKQGYSEKETFKKSVLKNILWQKFTIYKARELKIAIPKSEVLGLLEQITVSHILVCTKDLATNKPLRTDQEALTRANEIYQKITAGGDFAQLVNEYSDDAGSKAKSGVAFGPLPIELFKLSLPKDYVNVTLALKVEQISKPLRTELGYYLIRLDNRYMPQGNEYQQKYLEVENDLLPRKLGDNPAYSAYLNNVYQKAGQNMAIYDPWLKASHLKQAKKWEEAAKAYQIALSKNNYKNRIEIFMDAADVYFQLKQPKAVINVLKQAPVALTDTIDFQYALASAYKQTNELQKAKDILIKFGETHLDLSIHESLKEIYTQWNLPDLVAKETKIIDGMQK